MNPVLRMLCLLAWCGAGNALLAQPLITRQPASQSVSVGATVTFTAFGSGATPLTLQWLKDDQPISGATNFTLKLLSVRAADAARYQLRLTDINALEVLTVPANLTVDSTFTKITTGPPVEDRETSEGCAWGDFNRDGFQDLFVTNLEGRNALYQNKGDGTFTRVTTEPIGTDSATVSHGSAWVDFDNDGWLDLVVANINRRNYLYRNLGNGQFEKLSAATSGTILSDVDRSVGLTWADFDQDGWVDLFVPNGGLASAQPSRLYRNLGAGKFEPVLESPVVTGAFLSHQGAWADFDDDGDPDLFVTRHRNQANALYRNLGDGTFELVDGTPLTAEKKPSTGADWGDFDNDGRLDLFVTAWDGASNLRNSLFRNLGGGNFEQITEGAPATDTGRSPGCAWVDYDNDGWLDLFVTTDNQPRAFYRNLGNGRFIRLTEGSLVNDKTTAVGCAWADYDNDGFPDLYIANGGIVGPEVNGLYRNNGNTNAWIKVRCVGTLSNRSAVGAKIRIKARLQGKDYWQVRQVTAGSGYISQQSLEQCFGLGDATLVDQIRVEWPSGVVQELERVPVRQVLEVVEPMTLAPSLKLTNGQFQLQLSGKSARSLQVEASADLRTWQSLGTVSPTKGTLRLNEDAEHTSPRFYRLRQP